MKGQTARDSDNQIPVCAGWSLALTTQTLLPRASSG